MASFNAGRLEQTRRAIAFIRALQGYRYMPSWTRLANEVGVCERTARRYVQALEEAGWPLPRKVEKEAA